MVKKCEYCGRVNSGKNVKKYCSEGHIVPCVICGTMMELSYDRFCSYIRKESAMTCKPECKALLRKQSCLEKYGVEAPAQAEQFKEKAKQTNLERYGVENAMQSADIRDRLQQSMVDKYGVANSMQLESAREKSRQTNLLNHGVEYAPQSAQAKAKTKQTSLERYGVDNIMKSDEGKERLKRGMIDKYGVNHNMKVDSIRQKVKDTLLFRYGAEYLSQVEAFKQKVKETMLARYGVDNAMKFEEFKQKAYQTNIERYGATCIFLSEHSPLREYQKLRKSNVAFAQFLNSIGITEFEQEFVVDGFFYDFKIGNILVEINDSMSHNSTENNPYTPKHWNALKPKDYHLIKSQTAEKYGYQVMHIWDWDDIGKLALLLFEKQHILYARNLKIKEVSSDDTKEFLVQHHLQASCQNQIIRLGLYEKDELIQLMTFGAARYNKNFEYELLRLCTLDNMLVVGGAEKLFRYFVKNYSPSSIISYCDKSKFRGDVYTRLGMCSSSDYTVSKHWYNIMTHDHITDNLLRQRGFDQLLGKEYGEYGKGTSNEDLMRQAGYIEIYDAGQQVFTWLVA